MFITGKINELKECSKKILEEHIVPYGFLNGLFFYLDRKVAETNC